MALCKRRRLSDAFSSRPQKPNKRTFLSSSHPLAIKPLGNYYFESTNPAFKGSCRTSGLGFIAALSDELILDVIERFLEPRDLCRLAETSRVLYVFAHHDDLWRTWTVNEFRGNFTWSGTWRATYLKTNNPSYEIQENDTPVQVSDFYSDTLYQPFYCASASMEPFMGVENVERRSNLSMAEFVTDYAIPNKPVIITDIVTQWPAFGKWNDTYFLERYGDVRFRAEVVDIELRNYYRYAHNQRDESPLYLFDKKFVRDCPDIADDFEVPEYFREDYFSVLGNERPDYRWLIVGPARSGSTFHKDPNSTSAWNAVITGSKKWIMYPPDTVPPGVFTSEGSWRAAALTMSILTRQHVHPPLTWLNLLLDESEVTSPVSLMEWHLNFYKKIHQIQPRPIEAICRAGEVMFVPNGWWHMVVNLEDSIAITQNYVGAHNLLNVLRFLRDKPNQVSGVSDTDGFYIKFREAFQKAYPGFLERIEKEETEKRLTTWERLKDGGSRFSFGFVSDDE
ncbi:hypothetical protein BC938DRAFT_476395 [Jimgerdemannia flammicorona]|uniref:JmjC domain-containing protein n=1 Tax=Jimgerdemannia flammicorona TaxID=994334 RepID=A0A433PHK3_9FUNG|nr:hypothetical protein BC938DRAFT_476395 [Jimgerdemannia flammicorona]